MELEEGEGDAIGKKFSFMIQAIQGAQPDDVLKQFSKLNTDAQRFSFAWKLQATQDVIVLEKEFEGKSAEVAQKHREKGNEYFMKKSYLSALSEYNKSVVMAPLKGAQNEEASTNEVVISTEETKQENVSNKTVETNGGENVKEENTAETNDAKTGEKITAGETLVVEKQNLEEGEKESEKKKTSTNKNEIALAFANRSATLLHLKKYKNCLEDIELALEYGYPEDMQYKMLERRGKCYFELRNIPLAIESFQAAKNLIAATNLKEKTQKTLTETMDQQITKCTEFKPKETDEKIDEDSEREKKIPEISGDGRKSVHANLSTKVRIENAKNVGKHLVANEDVKVGDVLIVEKPFQWVVFTRFQSSHCYHCFKPVSVPIPCQQCTSVAYCGRECRDKSWNNFHQYECSYFVLFDTNMCGKIGNLALRLIMMMGPAALIEHAKTHGESPPKEELGTAAANSAYSADYDGVYNLVANTQERKLEDMFHLSVAACYLMKLLQLTGYNIQTETGSAEFDILGGVLLRHLQIAQCNAWKITELQKPEKFDDLKPEEIGIGLYTTAALVNHSCDPTADFNFFDDTLTLRAIRNIAKDEEVAVSYGPVFYEVKQIPRQNQLRKSHLFNCKCTACQEFWPIAAEMFDVAPGYSCIKCRATLNTEQRIERRYFKCSKCDHNSCVPQNPTSGIQLDTYFTMQRQDMEEVVGCLQSSFDTFAEAMTDALAGRSRDALPKFLQHHELLQRYIRHPWRDLAACQSAVKNCYRHQANSKQGN